MDNFAPYTMTKYERSELNKLLEPLTEMARAGVYDVFENWHERVKEKAVERAKDDLKSQIISDLAANY